MTTSIIHSTQRPASFSLPCLHRRIQPIYKLNRSVCDAQFPAVLATPQKQTRFVVNDKLKILKHILKKQTERNENKKSEKYQQDNASAVVSLLFQGNVGHDICQTQRKFDELNINIDRKLKRKLNMSIE